MPRWTNSAAASSTSGAAAAAHAHDDDEGAKEEGGSSRASTRPQVAGGLDLEFAVPADATEDSAAANGLEDDELCKVADGANADELSDTATGDSEVTEELEDALGETATGDSVAAKGFDDELGESAVEDLEVAEGLAGTGGGESKAKALTSEMTFFSPSASSTEIVFLHWQMAAVSIRKMSSCAATTCGRSARAAPPGSGTIVAAPQRPAVEWKRRAEKQSAHHPHSVVAVRMTLEHARS